MLLEKFDYYLNKANRMAGSFPEEIRDDMTKIMAKGMMYVVRLYESGWKPKWPEKLASIWFWYKGELHTIGYSAFGIGDLDQAMIYDLKNYLIEDFEAIGVEKVIAHGFGD